MTLTSFNRFNSATFVIGRDKAVADKMFKQKVNKTDRF